MKSISMDFQWIFDTVARNAPKKVQQILNMRNRLQLISKPSDGYLTKLKKFIKIDSKWKWKSILVTQQVSNIKREQFSYRINAAKPIFLNSGWDFFGFASQNSATWC